MKYLIILILFASCTVPERIVPDCDNITATMRGDALRIAIDSPEPSVQMCIDYGIRISCQTIQSHYFGCISIRGYQGEPITIESGKSICNLNQ